MAERLTQDPSLPVKNPTVSYWQTPPHAELVGIQSRTLPVTRDVVILGSGITSCSAAIELLQAAPRTSISILEAREVCSGATGRNGGRINCVAVLDYDKYLRRFGHEAAVKIVRFELAHYDAISATAKVFGQEVVEQSEIRQVDTLAAVFTDQRLHLLKQQLQTFEAAFPDLKGRWWICEGEELNAKHHLPTAKGALMGRAGASWPYRLVSSIFVNLLKVHGERFSIETNTPATGIRRDPCANQEFPYLITTPRGEIRAKQVLHCTEGHTAHHIAGLRGVLVPRRGQISVQNPGSAFPYKGGKSSWSFYFQNGFDYASQMPNSHDIVIGGGELGGIDGMNEAYGISADDSECIASKSHLAGILPVVFGPENWGAEEPGKMQLKASWVGILCSSLDGVPFVGRVPSEALVDRDEGDANSAEWVSAGYGGYGMVNAFLCGRSLAMMVMGREPDDLLPQQYRISRERVMRLQSEVKRLSGSMLYFKALL